VTPDSPSLFAVDTTLDARRSLFRDGRYSTLLNEIDQNISGSEKQMEELVLLAVRAELRLDKPAAALHRLQQRKEWSASVGLIPEILRGIAEYRVNQKDAGTQRLELVHATTARAEERAESAYYRAWTAYVERQLDLAERWLYLALDDACGALYARALALSAYIQEAREDYAGSARYFHLAVKALREAGDDSDRGLRDATMHNLAAYGAELPDAALTVFAAKNRNQWSSETDAPFVLHAVQGLLHIGLGFENAGRTEEAFDAFDEAAAHAHSRPTLWAATLLESAELYRLLGEDVAARRTLKKAKQQLRSIDADANVQDQMQLLECACLAARLEPVAANEWIARYAALSKRDDGRWALVKDRRVEALESHARGLVESTVGHRKTGVRRVENAYMLWTELGYYRRAAYAYADLQALGTKPDPKSWTLFAALSPHHPLITNSAGAAPGATLVPQLSPALHTVLESLCTGTSVREIAQKSGRSEYTIRNHLKRLFKAFGVKSTAALVAAALTSRMAVKRQDRR